MSDEATARAWRHAKRGIGSNDLVVLLCISNWCRAKFLWTGTLSEVADTVNISERSVRRCIGSLMEQGALAREDRPGKEATYEVLNPGQIGRGAPRQIVQGSESHSPGGLRRADIKAETTPDKLAGVTHDRLSARTDCPDTPDRLSEVTADRSSKDLNIQDPPIVPPRGDRARASRIPEDFELTPERRLVAEAEKLPAERTFAKFKNHWLAASGAKARKHDWDATWRNWCLNERDFSNARGSTGAAPSRPSPRSQKASIATLNNSAALLGIDKLREDETVEQLEVRINSAHATKLQAAAAARVANG